MHAARGSTVRLALSVCLVATLGVIGPACSQGSDTTATSTTTAERPSTVDFSERGPHHVGVLRTALPDGAPVEVFYPAADVPDGAKPYGYTTQDMWASDQEVWPVGWNQDVPDAWTDVPASSDGPFPLVVSSHGWGGTRFVHGLHLAHLASWGFVVAAPEHTSRDLAVRTSQETLPPNDAATVLATADHVRSLSEADGLLSGVVDPDALAIEGHSAGGRDAVLASQGGDVDTFISVAGTPPVADDAVGPGELFGLAPGTDLAAELDAAVPPEVPGLLVVSEEDGVVPPDSSRATYRWLEAPKRMVVIAGTGHVAYFDGCARYQRGELPGLAEALEMDPASAMVTVSEDGCTAQDPPADDVRAVWDHLSVAHLRWVFGLEADEAAASLKPEALEAAFPDLIAEVAAVEGA